MYSYEEINNSIVLLWLIVMFKRHPAHTHTHAHIYTYTYTHNYTRTHIHRHTLPTSFIVVTK